MLATLFDQVVTRVEGWLAACDRERDVACRMMARRGRTPELEVWLARLEGERARHVELLGRLRDLSRANYPALLLSRRPARAKVAKAALRRTRAWAGEKGA